MKVSELGEFGLIEMVAKLTAEAGVASAQDVVLGIGDDTAAWRADKGLELATTDTLVQGVHFNCPPATWEELGWKALAVNISDIAAMGGFPRYALVTLGLPEDTEVESLRQLYRGMAQIAKQYGVAIVGGDMVRAQEVFITVALTGVAQKLMTRSAARPGNQIAVTGYLGASAAGLRMLSDGLVFDEKITSLLRNAHLKPIPRLTEGQTLVRCGVRAAIDISDGLIADLGHICEASRVGAHLWVDRVPIHPMVRAAFGDEALKITLAGGEDYELLFTAPARVVKAVRESLALPVTVIGEVVKGDGEVFLLNQKGRRLPWQRRGWDHFAAGE